MTNLNACLMLLRSWSRPIVLMVAAAALLALLSVGSSTPTAFATGFTVDTTSDASLSACTVAPADCSLRGAIDDANGNPGADSITFDPSVFPGTITLGSALPALTAGSDTINGAGVGVTVDGVSQAFDCFTLSSDGNAIKGLQIRGCANGVNVTNTTSGNVIGGTTGTTPGACTGDCNVISGNGGTGITLSGAGQTVQGNFIGLDAGGAPLGNGFGIGAIGSNTSSIVGNVISSNGTSGISMLGGAVFSDQVLGNLIGTDPTGLVSRGNGLNGVLISGGHDNTVGSVASPNTIAFNTRAGVCINGNSTVVGNAIRANSIHDNGGLGIDLTASGSCSSAVITPNDANDADTGANALQNFPVLIDAYSGFSAPGLTILDGTLNSTANTSFTIDLFASSSCDASGNGEGQTYIGSVSPVTTDGSGNAPFEATLLPFTAGQAITATATRISAPLDTSEFSACMTATPGVVNGYWASVFSETYPNPQVNAGDCEGLVLGPPTGLGSAGPTWDCESNHVSVATGGTYSASMTSQTAIAGHIDWTGPNFPFTTTFSGTMSPDGRSSTGTWAESGASGTYSAALQESTSSSPGQMVTGAGNSSLTFGGPSSGGDTSIITAPTSGGTLPPQYSLVGSQYYHVITDVTGGGPFTFCAQYTGTSATNDVVNGTLETLLEIGHLLSNGTWEFPGRAAGSDPVTNTVCVQTSSLSEFALTGSSLDADADGLSDGSDNCPTVANANQMNSDADTLGNACDNCITVANQNQMNQDGDEYGDACEQPNCVTVINHWVVPSGDADCDGWTDVRETFSGTVTNQKCMATSDPNDEAGTDAWPVDYNDDQLSNGQDILKYNPKFGTFAPGGPAPNQYSVRYDLNGDGLINGQDILKHNAYFGKLCSP
jgi:hypothetical protein